MEDGSGVEINNEFAVVVVGIDRALDAPRLRIHDRRSGTTGFLDASQMEALVTASRLEMDALLDPARRWGDDEDRAHRP